MRIRSGIIILRAIPLFLAIGFLALGLRVLSNQKAKTLAVIEAERMHRCLPDVEDHLLIRPEDVAAFGDVIVTTPEHSLKEDHMPFQGWEEAREMAIGLASPVPGEYAADIISHVYKFSSPERAQAAFASLPEPGKDGTWKNGTPSLDEQLVELLNICSTTWVVKYTIDGDGLSIYAAVLQIGPYVVDVYMTTFAVRFIDELPIDASTSADERKQAYIEFIQRKMEKGMTFQQLVDTERAQAFGQRLLNHLLWRILSEGDVTDSSS